MNAEKQQPSQVIEGQLNAAEREFISQAILDAPVKPKIALEVGAWLGGGSTLHILRALHKNETGHLWGVEAAKNIYEDVLTNIGVPARPEAVERFTPLLGLSTEVLPEWFSRLPHDQEIDFVFLDGGDNPSEQIEEFELLADRIKTGGVLLAHDAFTRKGKWFVPYVSLLDNWQTEVFSLSPYGLVRSYKIKARPSAASRAAARRKFRRLQLEPMELVSRFLPRRLCGLILNLMPKRLRARLTVGAK